MAEKMRIPKDDIAVYEQHAATLICRMWIFSIFLSKKYDMQKLGYIKIAATT
jgi:hypothetical protein